MPAKPRSDVFEPDEVGVYHCWNRLVRRHHLFGWDALTGNDYSYRKDWVRDRFRELAGAMAINVLDYAILDNHLHIHIKHVGRTVGRLWTGTSGQRGESGSTCQAARVPVAEVPKPAEENRASNGENRKPSLTPNYLRADQHTWPRKARKPNHETSDKLWHSCDMKERLLSCEMTQTAALE